MAPDLSVIVLSWNTRDLLRECLESVERGRGALSVEVVVIDNASSDGSAEMVAAQFPSARLARNDSNRGYATGVNQGIALSTGRKICLLGSDTRVAPDALPKLCAFLDAHPAAGAVAPRLVNPDGTVQRACMRFPTLKTVVYWDTFLARWFPKNAELVRYQYKDWDHSGTRVVDQPPGTCLVIPRGVVDKIGSMDERLWLFFNDVDWALRMRDAGLDLWYLDDADVVHHLGGSTRHYSDFGAEWHRNRIAFYRKHFRFVGVAMAKTAAIYVAVRQCFRVRGNERSWRAAWPHCRSIMKALGGMLVR
jgi:N-acetylglucosaminyl-diphospho-decaprenol L-rhamnosyltransferase